MKKSEVSKEKILIIDDHSDDLRLLSRILMEEGYQVQAQDNTQLDFDSLITPLPDLILLNLAQANRENFQFFQQLKTAQHTQEIPIIFLIHFNQPSEKLKVFEVGGSDYIAKPLQIPEIFVRIETQLQLQWASLEIENLNRELENSREKQSERLEQAIYEHQRLQTRLTKLVWQSPLTGLSNRMAMINQLQAVIAKTKDNQKYQFAVLFLNCDYFKAINDFLGHLVADRLLIALARRLKSCLRPFDTIAHFGGMSFSFF